MDIQGSAQPSVRGAPRLTEIPVGAVDEGSQVLLLNNRLIALLAEVDGERSEVLDLGFNFEGVQRGERG